MPGATVSYTNEAPEHNYRIGFPLGFRKVQLLPRH
jgi:transmembrane 9 superfamily protein 2/4